MTRAQAAFAFAAVAGAALLALQFVVFEALIGQEWLLPRTASVVEQASLSLVGLSVRWGASVVTAYMVLQALLLLTWVFRPPQPATRVQLGRRCLSTWFLFSLLVAVMGLVVGLGTRWTALGPSTPMLTLVPLFGWAYCACIYWTLKLQGRAGGRMRVETQPGRPGCCGRDSG